MPQRRPGRGGRDHPPPDALLALLRDRSPRTAAEVAALAGLPADDVERGARDREALLPDGRIEWSEGVAWVLESWPLPALFQSLGPRADVFPSGLQLIAMTLELPAYLVAALRVQSRIEPMPHRRVRPETFDDYMSDLLHRAIDGRTVEALSGDEEFLRAYHFPGEPDDE